MLAIGEVWGVGLAFGDGVQEVAVEDEPLAAAVGAEGFEGFEVCDAEGEGFEVGAGFEGCGFFPEDEVGFLEDVFDVGTGGEAADVAVDGRLVAGHQLEVFDIDRGHGLRRGFERE